VSVEAKVESTVTVPVALTGALAIRVTDPIVTVAPLTAPFAERVRVEVAAALMPSVVVVAVQAGAEVPLVETVPPHPPPVHF
jgi:hypothetical protein